MSKLDRFLVLFLLCGILVLPSAAQTKYTDDEVEALSGARALLEKEELKKAEKAFRKITKQNPEIGRAWIGLGLALLGQSRFEESIKAYEGALTTNLSGVATYNTACAYARWNKVDEAFAWLDKALDEGLRNVRMLRQDSDLDNVRDDPRFVSVMIRAGASPCMIKEEYSGLDFWEGAWQGRVGDETFVFAVGELLNGCLRIEFSRTDAGAPVSTAFLYYEPSADLWRQESFIRSGAVRRLSGSLKGETLLLEGEQIETDGRVGAVRMKLSSGGEDLVSRRLERSEDSGATWTLQSASSLKPLTDQVPPPPTELTPSPCPSDRQAALDSWAGAWEMPGGEDFGPLSLSISRSPDACFLMGRFDPAQGASALMWTYYDPAAGEWKQIWVTATGDVIRYAGEAKHDVLSFEGERVRWDGTKVLSRSTATIKTDGTTRYRIEDSMDGGNTWAVWLDATRTSAISGSNAQGGAPTP